MKLNKEKLDKKIKRTLICIDLNNPENVEDNNEIYIFQHPNGDPIAASWSPCRIVSKFGYMDS